MIWRYFIQDYRQMIIKQDIIAAYLWDGRPYFKAMMTSTIVLYFYKENPLPDKTPSEERFKIRLHYSMFSCCIQLLLHCEYPTTQL